MAWTPFSVAAPAGLSLPGDVIAYGPGIPDESTFRLLGDVAGKRVVDLGCGAGRNAVALARAGARTIAAESDPDQVAAARATIDESDVRVELHQTSLAELAFLRADTIDAVLSVYSLAGVTDIGRVFRQLHRVLRPEHPFVLSLPHPMFAVVDPGSDDDRQIRRSAFDADPYGVDDPRAGSQVRSLATTFLELSRAGFRVDTVLEPPAVDDGGPHWSPVMEFVPATVVIRARKQGL